MTHSEHSLHYLCPEILSKITIHLDVPSRFNLSKCCIRFNALSSTWFKDINVAAIRIRGFFTWEFLVKCPLSKRMIELGSLLDSSIISGHAFPVGPQLTLKNVPNLSKIEVSLLPSLINKSSQDSSKFEREIIDCLICNYLKTIFNCNQTIRLRIITTGIQYTPVDSTIRWFSWLRNIEVSFETVNMIHSDLNSDDDFELLARENIRWAKRIDPTQFAKIMTSFQVTKLRIHGCSISPEVAEHFGSLVGLELWWCSFQCIEEESQPVLQLPNLVEFSINFSLVGERDFILRINAPNLSHFSISTDLNDISDLDDFEHLDEFLPFMNTTMISIETCKVKVLCRQQFFGHINQKILEMLTEVSLPKLSELSIFIQAFPALSNHSKPIISVWRRTVPGEWSSLDRELCDGSFWTFLQNLNQNNNLPKLHMLCLNESTILNFPS